MTVNWFYILYIKGGRINYVIETLFLIIKEN